MGPETSEREPRWHLSPPPYVTFSSSQDAEDVKFVTDGEEWGAVAYPRSIAHARLGSAHDVRGDTQCF